MHTKLGKIKTCMYTVCWGFKYDNLRKGKTYDHKNQSPTLYLELKMLCLFYFVLESEIIAIISRLQ